MTFFRLFELHFCIYQLNELHSQTFSSALIEADKTTDIDLMKLLSFIQS